MDPDTFKTSKSATNQSSGPKMISGSASEQNVFFSHVCLLRELKSADSSNIMTKDSAQDRPSFQINDLHHEDLEPDDSPILVERSKALHELVETRVKFEGGLNHVLESRAIECTTPHRTTSGDDSELSEPDEFLGFDNPNILKLTKMKWLTEEQGSSDSSSQSLSSVNSFTSASSFESVSQCNVLYDEIDEKYLSTIIRLDKEHNLFGLSNVPVVAPDTARKSRRDYEKPIFHQTAIVQVCCVKGCTVKPCCKHKTNSDLPLSLKCGRCISCARCFNPSCTNCLTTCCKKPCSIRPSDCTRACERSCTPPRCRKAPCRRSPCRRSPCRPSPCRRSPCRQSPCRPSPCSRSPCLPAPCRGSPCRPPPCKRSPSGPASCCPSPYRKPPKRLRCPGKPCLSTPADPLCPTCLKGASSCISCKSNCIIQPKCCRDRSPPFGMKVNYHKKRKYEADPVELTPRASCVLTKPMAARSCHHTPHCIPPSSCFPYLMPCYWPARASAPCSAPTHCFHRPPCLPRRKPKLPIPEEERCSKYEPCEDTKKNTKCPNLFCLGKNKEFVKQFESKFQQQPQKGKK